MELAYTLWLQVPLECEQSFVVAISDIFLLYFCVADVDECASDSHQCNPTQICINTEGGYTCSCTEGYWLLEGQCLGKNLLRYGIWAPMYVHLWIAEIMSLSIFVKYTVKPSATWKRSFTFVSANSMLGRQTPSWNKNVDVNAIWLFIHVTRGIFTFPVQRIPFHIRSITSMYTKRSVPKQTCLFHAVTLWTRRDQYLISKNRPVNPQIQPTLLLGGEKKITSELGAISVAPKQFYFYFIIFLLAQPCWKNRPSTNSRGKPFSSPLLQPIPLTWRAHGMMK